MTLTIQYFSNQGSIQIRKVLRNANLVAISSRIRRKWSIALSAASVTAKIAQRKQESFQTLSLILRLVNGRREAPSAKCVIENFSSRALSRSRQNRSLYKQALSQIQRRNFKGSVMIFNLISKRTNMNKKQCLIKLMKLIRIFIISKEL